MIRGSFRGPPGRRRPQIVASVEIDPNRTLEDIVFIVDTGADRSLLSRSDVEAFGLDLGSLPQGRSTGVGGTATTAWVTGVLELGERRFRVTFRVLVRGNPTQREVPSLLGADVLAHFGLYIEDRRDLVLLFEPGEAEALSFEPSGRS